MEIHLPKRYRNHYSHMLRRYLLPQKKTLLLLSFLLTGSIGLQLLNPQFIRNFIDTAQSQGEMKELFYAGGLFIAFSLGQQLISVIASFVSENLGWRTTNELRSDLAEHCLSLDLSFHKEHTSGTFIERVDGDVNSLTNFFSSFIIQFGGNIVLILGILIFLFRESMFIGTGMLLFVLLAIFILQRIRKSVVPSLKQWRAANADFYGFIGEQLEGTEDIRANGATGYVMSRFYGMLRKLLRLQTKAFLGLASMWGTTVLVFTLGNAMAFAISAYLWKQGGLTLGTVYIIFYYTELLVKPVESLRTQLEDLQKAEASILRISELLHTRSKIEDGPGTPLPNGLLAVEFDNVAFAYEDRPTLEELSFKLEPGSTLGLLGRTGSGKTTIARLLFRFYDPNHGRILLNDIDIRKLKLHELRQKIGLVTQNIEIMEGTLRDNLTMFDDRIQDSAIIEILNDLGLDRWYRSLPAGLDTIITSSGTSLSAGEAQLLAFARVFLTEPGLVILDEASSRLDPLTEKRIEHAVDRLIQERTCIIIAHRLATLERADQIIVLRSGRIQEQGRRVDLLADPGSLFNRMLAMGIERVGL